MKEFLQKVWTTLFIEHQIPWRVRHYLASSKLGELWRFIRLQKPVTMVLGATYRINPYMIEIDITYECNIKCINCNRSCAQAPSDERVSLDQIDKFTNESMQQERKWKVIGLAGGEPTLHPQLLDIIERLLLYKKNFSPDTRIVVNTNGFGEIVKRALSQLPEEVIVKNSEKKSAINPFNACNMAPKDSILYKYVDYSNGCSVINFCGIGLTPYGYYPCAVSGNIDRVFGLDIGRKKLPPIDDLMLDELKVLCQYCGTFKRFIKDKLVTEERISSSWDRAFKQYKIKKPILSRY